MPYRLDVRTGPFNLAFSKKTYVMGVLNVTPDSFSDGGKFLDKDTAVRHGLEMARSGADIIDVGGESTRPGAEEVGIDEELNRVIPVIDALKKLIKIPISIDTRKAEVADAAVSAGAVVVNDISGLRHDPGMAALAARRKTALIVMHMKGTPHDMQRRPRYKNLIGEIIADLAGSIRTAKRAGVQEGKIIIDPGIGFGKTVKHNLEILNRLGEFKRLSRPICIGTSRKSFIGKILGNKNPGDRLAGTLATCAIAIMKGANLIRVHDVSQAREAAVIADSILRIQG